MTQRSCNLDPCPIFEWMATSDWGNCSALCGSGLEERDVHCVNTRPPSWSGVSFDISLDNAPCAHQPKPPTVQPCVVPNSVCFGNGGDQSKVANGMCTADGKCLCRAGWAGQYCDQQPSITDVLTNGASYTSSGIPFGDTLQISWQSKGNMPYVSILLIRSRPLNATDRWPVASYIARGIVNTGVYSWSVGSDLPDLESGDGFVVIVWFSPTIQAESDKPFSIADPCAYKNCGTHGTCSTGGVCKCVEGYSGDTCALGPCERARCSSSFGSCNNLDYIGKNDTTSSTVGICLCGRDARGQWDGSQCRTSPGCTPRCKNGADLVNVIVDINGKTNETAGECGVCACNNMWAGDDCSVCGLNCQHGGKIDADCSTCDCSTAPGYFGTLCSCKYYELELILRASTNEEATMRWMSDPIDRARFQRTLAIDLALAAGEGTGVNVHVDVKDVKMIDGGAILALVHFGLECPIMSQDVQGSGSSVDTERAKQIRGITTAAESAISHSFTGLISAATVKDERSAAYFPLRPAMEAWGRPSRSRRLVDDDSDAVWNFVSFIEEDAGAAHEPSAAIEYKNGQPTLLSVYQIVALMLEDLSSPMYRGVVTSSLTEGMVLTVKDLSGQDQPRTPDAPHDPFTLQQNQEGGGGGGGLSMGAVAGVIVACVLGTALMAFLIYYVLRMRHRRVKTPLASMRQGVHGGVELGSSAPASAAPSAETTPHHTPPQQQRTLRAPSPRATEPAPTSESDVALRV